jgi:hypothetical protein
VPKERLRRVDSAREPWFYLDNGATEFQWDNHDNTAVVRWSLRAHGVVLAGPDPKAIVEPISEDDLRADVLTAVNDWQDWLFEPLALERPSPAARRPLLLPDTPHAREGDPQAPELRSLGERTITDLDEPARLYELVDSQWAHLSQFGPRGTPKLMFTTWDQPDLQAEPRADVRHG